LLQKRKSSDSEIIAGAGFISIKHAGPDLFVFSLKNRRIREGKRAGAGRPTFGADSPVPAARPGNTQINYIEVGK